MATRTTNDDFGKIQLAWINALASPGLQDVLHEVAKPANSTMREGDVARLMSDKGVVLPKTAKASLAAAAGDEPVGVRLCFSFGANGEGGFHCMPIRTPITFG